MWNRNTERNCKDCGRQLDSFGVCPNTNPAEVGTMAAPVYCGGPKAHPVTCSCFGCIDRQERTQRILEVAA